MQKRPTRNVKQPFLPRFQPKKEEKTRLFRASSASLVQRYNISSRNPNRINISQHRLNHQFAAICSSEGRACIILRGAQGRLISTDAIGMPPITEEPLVRTRARRKKRIAASQPLFRQTPTYKKTAPKSRPNAHYKGIWGLGSQKIRVEMKKTIKSLGEIPNNSYICE